MKTLFVVIVGLALAAPAVADSPTWSQLGSPENRWGGTSVAFSSDGAMLASNLGSTVVLWDVASQSLWATLQDTSYVYSVTFSLDGTMLASCRDNTVVLWDVAKQKRLAILEGYVNRVTSVAFSPDGATLASGSNDHTVSFGMSRRGGSGPPWKGMWIASTLWRFRPTEPYWRPGQAITP